MPRRVLWIALLAIAPLVLAAAPASAQQDMGDRSVERLMDDFIHFVRIDDPDVAAAIGREILSRGLTEREFAALIEDSDRFRLADFEDAVGKAMKRPELEPIVGEMERLFLAGKRSEARDPQEISRNIEMLVGNLRARRIARERLIAASEYAMAQLLDAFLDVGNQERRTQVQLVMEDMGPGAVMPLCTALPHLSSTDQQSVVEVLGIVGYPTALPFIAEVLESADTPDLRAACERAIARIGRGDRSLDPARLFYELAVGYFNERSELTVFPGESFQLLWTYDPGLGLTFTPIATPVFDEAMCMRFTERSMRLDPSDSFDPVALWVGANFKREIETPAGYDNPAYELPRDALFYAVASGAEINQAVLQRALMANNTQLARRAIAALAQTAGGTALWTGQDGQPAPLIDALQYPSRRVQYEAALVLGAAQPRSSFPGSERVVPTLASAVRDASDQYALIITPDRDAYNELRGLVTGMGYDALAFAANNAEAARLVADAPGVDLLVIEQSSPERTADTLAQARVAPKLRVAPALLLTSADGAIDLSNRYRGNRLVAVRQRSITTQMMQQAVTGIVESGAGGPITDDEARAYTARSLDVLLDLAMASGSVLDASESARYLIVALPNATGQTQLRIAEVLGWINQARAQVALMDAALDASGEQQARLIDVVAASARRHGNQLEPRQITRVVGLMRSGADREATAAAALVGSLNLEGRDLVPLILGEQAEAIGQR